LEQNTDHTHTQTRKNKKKVLEHMHARENKQEREASSRERERVRGKRSPRSSKKLKNEWLVMREREAESHSCQKNIKSCYNKAHSLSAFLKSHDRLFFLLIIYTAEISSKK